MRIFLVYLIFLVFSFPAFAECVTQENSNQDSTCVVTELNGVRGIWFNLEESEKIRHDRLELHEVHLQLEHLERLVVLQEQRIEFYLEIINQKNISFDLLSIELDELLNRHNKLKISSGKWYRNPIFWFSAGVVVTSATCVIISVTSD
jgi:hypothetical protein